MEGSVIYVLKIIIIKKCKNTATWYDVLRQVYLFTYIWLLYCVWHQRLLILSMSRYLCRYVLKTAPQVPEKLPGNGNQSAAMTVSSVQRDQSVTQQVRATAKLYMLEWSEMLCCTWVYNGKGTEWSEMLCCTWASHCCCAKWFQEPDAKKKKKMWRK